MTLEDIYKISSIIGFLLCLASVVSFIFICSEYPDGRNPLWLVIAKLFGGVIVLVGSFIFWAHLLIYIMVWIYL